MNKNNKLTIGDFVKPLYGFYSGNKKITENYNSDPRRKENEILQKYAIQQVAFSIISIAYNTGLGYMVKTGIEYISK